MCHPTMVSIKQAKMTNICLNDWYNFFFFHISVLFSMFSAAATDDLLIWFSSIDFIIVVFCVLLFKYLTCYTVFKAFLQSTLFQDIFYVVLLVCRFASNDDHKCSKDCSRLTLEWCLTENISCKVKSRSTAWSEDGKHTFLGVLVQNNSVGAAHFIALNTIFNINIKYSFVYKHILFKNIQFINNFSFTFTKITSRNQIKYKQKVQRNVEGNEIPHSNSRFVSI